MQEGQPSTVAGTKRVEHCLLVRGNCGQVFFLNGLFGFEIERRMENPFVALTCRNSTAPGSFVTRMSRSQAGFARAVGGSFEA